MTITHRIDWMFESESLSSIVKSDSAKKVPIPYPSELATGYSEHLELPEGILLIRDTHNFTSQDLPSKISLGNFKVEFPSKMFVCQIMHSGMVGLHERNRYSQRAPGIDLFSRINSIDLDLTLFTEEDIYLSNLFIPESQLYSLMGRDSAESLFISLGLNKILDFCELKIPQTISKKIAYCNPDHLEGSMLSLFALSIILQYLLELNLYISSSKSFLNDLEKDDFNVDSLHAELLQVTASIPNLAELSRKYDVSPAKLNQAFIKKYDQSIYSFLSNQRLDQAYQALTDTAISMKMLAHKIGYSHVNHFITAFKKKFGVTPGSIRD
jgi:AraC-like DNA-binding protein